MIENYPEDRAEQLDAVNNPEDASAGTRQVPFSREIYIEQDDFREDPPKKYFRLVPGGEVRLRYGYIIKCTGVVKDPATGAVTELRCTYDPATHSGSGGQRRAPGEGDDPLGVRRARARRRGAALRPALLRRASRGRRVELPRRAQSGLARSRPGLQGRAGLASAAPETRFQFERLGYFVVDRDSASHRLVFNRTVTLRDQWAKIEKKLGG